jgi:hypothetical protein
VEAVLVGLGDPRVYGHRRTSLGSMAIGVRAPNTTLGEPAVSNQCSRDHPRQGDTVGICAVEGSRLVEELRTIAVLQGPRRGGSRRSTPPHEDVPLF